MARYVATVPSPHAAQDVFDCLSDFATIADWDPGVARAHLVSGEAGQVGAVYQVDTTLLGRVTPLDYHLVVVVTAPDGTRRVDLRAENDDFVSYDVITVTPTGSGCAVRYEADLALKGFRRPFDPALRVLFQIIGRRAEGGLARAVATDPLPGVCR